MTIPSKPLRLTPLRLVLVPLATLSLVFAMIAMVAWASEAITIVSPSSLLVTGALIYAATIFLLSRNGFANLRELETLGETDTLSQLPNRRALHREIEEYSNSGDEVAIALIDLDGFKQVNDHYGHAIGDKLI